MSDMQVRALGGVRARALADGVRVRVPAQGPPGSGATAASHLHAQAAPAPVWTINHNLGARPAITLLTPGGIEMHAQIVHVSANQAVVTFAEPMAGSARCI